jgi:PAS domain S-box-containing protein
MSDKKKTNTQPAVELAKLRRKLKKAELELGAERKQIETDLRRREEEYRTILDNMEEAYHWIDLNGNATFVNNACIKMLGYSRDELIGMNYRSYAADKENADKVYQAYNKVYKTGEPLKNFEWDIVRKDGTRRTVEVSVSLLRDAQHNPSGFTGIAKDVTDLKRAESQLVLSRQYEEKYRILLDEIEDLYSEVDLAGNYTFFNDSFCKAFGYNRDEMMGLNYRLCCVSEDHANEIYRLYNQMYKTGVPIKRYEWQIVTKNGVKRIMEYYASVIRDPEGQPTGFRGIGRDITERKAAEEQYRIVSNNLQGGVYIVLDGKICFVNPYLLKLTGYSEEELIGISVLDFVHPDDRGTAKDRGIKMLKGGQASPFQLRVIDKNGDIKWVMVTVSSITYQGKQAVLGNFMDITGRKKAEAEKDRLEAMLLQSQKMEAIGTLAGGIAHDFNNILAAMRGYTDLAKLKTKDMKIARDLDHALQACDRARDLVQQILTFSRQTEQEKKPIMLLPLIKEVSKLMRASLPAMIEIKHNLKVKSDLIMADATQMHQLMMNLCMNAGQAMKSKGGLLEISLEETTIDYKDSRYHILEPGRYLRLTVRDTGHGIEESHLKRIFDPYFTTKRIGEGTGLGLSVVDGIVKSHGGAIEVSSKVGEGSAFHVYLPFIEELKTVDKRKDTVALSRGNETILFIDDEKMLANVIKTILEELGYKVFMETDPTKAVKFFNKSKGDIDLVITDKTMPRMTGFDVARKLRKIRPDIPIIMCSGFQDKDDQENLSLCGIKHFFIKPMKIEEIAEIIRNILDKKI